MNNNLSVLHREMDWLQAVVDQALSTYLGQEGGEKSWLEIPLPDFSGTESYYAAMLAEWQPDNYSRLALALSMAPNLRPEMLDIFFGKNQMYDRRYTEFGGITDGSHSGFLPTIQTFSFLLGTAQPEPVTHALMVLHKDNSLIADEVIVMSETGSGSPKLSAVLALSDSWFHYFITGKEVLPEDDPSFPARKISTVLNWEDLVLDSVVMKEVEEISEWIRHTKVLMDDWGLSKNIKPGYCALFDGPTGTGKTLTAILLGKTAGMDVYKIDLPLIFGSDEPEKTLSRIFKLAEQKNWMLFFDDIDRLFPKDSNDRQTNQQISCLLQRIEDFPGVVIIASNLRSGLDEAFARKFQAIIVFSLPGAEERYRLWQNAFSGKCMLPSSVDLHKIAVEYELSGGSIMNVLRHCALSAARNKNSKVTEKYFMDALHRELKN